MKRVNFHGFLPQTQRFRWAPNKKLPERNMSCFTRLCYICVFVREYFPWASLPGGGGRDTRTHTHAHTHTHTQTLGGISPVLRRHESNALAHWATEAPESNGAFRYSIVRFSDWFHQFKLNRVHPPFLNYLTYFYLDFPSVRILQVWCNLGWVSANMQYERTNWLNLRIDYPQWLVRWKAATSYHISSRYLGFSLNSNFYILLDLLFICSQFLSIESIRTL